MADEMEEIISEFVMEASETLERIDPLFVELETKGYNKEMLNEIFRGMHTLKGAAGFLGFQPIVDVAHRAESIMKRLRDAEIVLSKELMDVILQSVDALRLLIFHIKTKDGAEEDISGLLGELDRASESAKLTSSVDAGPSEGPVREAAVEVKADVGSAPAGVGGTPEGGDEQVRHEVEHNAEPEIKSPPPSATISVSAEQAQQMAKEREMVSHLRVDVARIDKVMDLAGEIVLARNRLLNLATKLDMNYSDDPFVESLLETTGFLDRVTSDLQLAVMKMRMQPIQKVFGKFPRMVRDMSRTLDKDIDLEMFGEDTEVDKTVIENIGDPLVHIIRNSIDHAIEHAGERQAKGKPKKGRIIMSAYQRGTQIVIEVSDDGKGIDVEAVKRKALSKGLISEEESQKMSDEAAINLIFLPGFSTKEVSTELSGRGVGMDVVKTNVGKLNGYVEVISKKDIGTTFKISLPLTLAILQAMMVRVGGEYYAVPQSMIEETLRIKKSDIKDITGQRVLTIRGRVIPMFNMSDVLTVRNKDDDTRDYVYVLVAIVG
ncbi:MAG: chemotaxis protein CheA, partial [Nitrospirae bacterium]|nr:chemotaxis protein CheA [Nitrospirota bacterium]